MNDPLDSAIPVGSGPGQTVPPSTPPPVAHAPRAVPSGNDKIWALFSHLSGFVGLPILLPLIVYLSMRGDSRYVADNAKEALNFHISATIYCIVCVITVVGIPVAILLGLASLILGVIGAVKAADGEIYRYPLTLRLIK